MSLRELQEGIPLCGLLLPGKRGNFQESLLQHYEQDYAARYRKDGDEREVLLIGLNYISETKEHHCLIEKM